MILLFKWLTCLLMILSWNADVIYQSQCGDPLQTSKDVFNQIAQVNTNWAKYINNGLDSLGSVYHPRAIKILEEDQALNSKSEILDYYASNSTKIVSHYSDTIIMANERLGIAYEIGGFENDQNQPFKHLIIWQKDGDVMTRNFEYIVRASNIQDDQSQVLNKRRTEWITLCNAHNARNLIEALYSENTIYYNHRPLVKGRESLIPIYSYMNNPNYGLKLEPIIVEPVNNDFIFEIGQCIGSYGGKYILIWKPNDEGVWEIYIDSNI